MSPTNIRPRPLDLLGLAVILIAACALRLVWPEISEYRQDEANLMSLVLDMTTGKGIPFVGIPSSVGIPNSPMTVYLLLPPFLLSHDPAAAIVYIGALNVVGVGLLWLIAYRYVGRLPAFLGGLAYAVNPWAVLYSRKIWAQDYHTPIILLALLLALYGFIERKRWAQIVCLPVLLVGLQVHFAAWSLLPVYVWLVWIGRRHTTGRILIVSGVLGILVLTPYLVGIVESAGTFDSSLRDRWTLDEIGRPGKQTTSLITGIPMDEYLADVLPSTLPRPGLLWVFTGAAALVGAGVAWRRRNDSVSIMIVLWAYITTAVLTVGAGVGYISSVGVKSWEHYYIPSIPALCLLVGMGIEAIWKWRPYPTLRIAVGGLFGVIFITQFLTTPAMLRQVDHQFNTAFGTPFHYLFNVRDDLRTYDDVVVIGSGDYTNWASNGAAIWKALLYDTTACVREVLISDTVAVFPDAPFAAVWTETAPDNYFLTAIYHSEQVKQIPLVPGGATYTIYSIATQPEVGTVINEIEPAVFANGLTLTGYRLDDTHLLLRWRLPQPGKTPYVTIIDFLNADGGAVAHYEADFWHERNWCAGDVLLDWIAAAAPPESVSAQISIRSAVQNQEIVSLESGATSVEVPIN